jgi:hypothetical protein
VLPFKHACENHLKPMFQIIAKLQKHKLFDWYKHSLDLLRIENKLNEDNVRADRKGEHKALKQAIVNTQKAPNPIIE